MMPERNIIYYNSIVLVLGLYGCASRDFFMFDVILEKGLVPDEATFITLLCACCHVVLYVEFFHMLTFCPYVDFFHILTFCHMFNFFNLV